MPKARRAKLSRSGTQGAGKGAAADRLEDQLDDFENRLTTTVNELEQQLRSTNAVMIQQAEAFSLIIDNAESSVTALARLCSSEF